MHLFLPLQLQCILFIYWSKEGLKRFDVAQLRVVLTLTAAVSVAVVIRALSSPSQSVLIRDPNLTLFQVTNPIHDLLPLSQSLQRESRPSESYLCKDILKVTFPAQSMTIASVDQILNSCSVNKLIFI